MKNKFLVLSELLFVLSGCSTIQDNSPSLIMVKATETGFSPSEIVIPSNTEHITVRFERVTDHTCAREVVFEEQSINQELPLRQPVDVTFSTKNTEEIVYGCHMDKMHKGIIRKKK